MQQMMFKPCITCDRCKHGRDLGANDWDAGIRNARTTANGSYTKTTTPANGQRSRINGGNMKKINTETTAGKGLTPSDTKDTEKKVSLLKQKNNFDRIKEMDMDELAERLTIVELNAALEFSVMPDAETYAAVKAKRKLQWLEYLKSEVEE